MQNGSLLILQILSVYSLNTFGNLYVCSDTIQPYIKINTDLQSQFDFCQSKLYLKTTFFRILNQLVYYCLLMASSKNAISNLEVIEK